MSSCKKRKKGATLGNALPSTRHPARSRRGGPARCGGSRVHAGAAYARARRAAGQRGRVDRKGGQHGARRGRRDGQAVCSAQCSSPQSRAHAARCPARCGLPAPDAAPCCSVCLSRARSLQRSQQDLVQVGGRGRSANRGLGGSMQGLQEEGKAIKLQLKADNDRARLERSRAHLLRMRAADDTDIARSSLDKVPNRGEQWQALALTIRRQRAHLTVRLLYNRPSAWTSSWRSSSIRPRQRVQVLGAPLRSYLPRRRRTRSSSRMRHV